MRGKDWLVYLFRGVTRGGGLLKPPPPVGMGGAEEEPLVLTFEWYREVCPNFGHPALTSSFTECEFLLVKNSFSTIVIELSFLKLFQLSNGDLLFSCLNLE